MDDGESTFRKKSFSSVGKILGLGWLSGTTDKARDGGWFKRFRVAERDDVEYEKSLLEDSDRLPTINLSENEGAEFDVPEKLGTSSFWQATINTVAALFGMGLLALPYAAEQGGWSGLIFLVIFALMCCYTGFILGHCLEQNRLLNSYQDIVGSALGPRGRLIFTLILYSEMLASLVGFAIALGDNLAQLFPGLIPHLSWLHLKPSSFLMCLAMLVIAPTVLMRDLSYVSYLSFGGIMTSLVIVGAVAWTGIFDVGFTKTIPFAHPGKWRFVLGLYSYCYSGHPIIPNLYMSMRDPSKFPAMLMLSFSIATVIYAVLGLMGAAMFGRATLSQITLNIPTNLPVAKVVLWTTVLTPVAKFSLEIAPIALDLESFLPFDSNSKAHLALGSFFRLCILSVIVAVAIAFPDFGTTLEFIGSSISIVMSIIFPCGLDLILHRREMPRIRAVVDWTLIVVAFVLSVVGTWSSSNITQRLL